MTLTRSRQGTATALAVGSVLVILGEWGACGADLEPGARVYPIEIDVRFHAALFHWVDSLAGTSGGKTIPAHQKQFRAWFGEPTQEDFELLDRFRKARLRDARRIEEGSTSPRGLARLRQVFLEADSLGEAFDRADREMDLEDAEDIRETLRIFGTKYREIWNEVETAEQFTRRLQADPDFVRLERLLADIATFFDVDLTTAAHPTVVPVPVPSGHGTHATAVGSYLLIEVRPPDRLANQASVIVHENAHYLFSLIDDERRERLESIAGSSRRNRRAWLALREALPTALGQGVADREFRPGSWSLSSPWYHTEEVDAYAKKLYPLVRRTLRDGGRFDEGFFERALRAYR